MEKVNGKCFSYALAGTTIFLVSLFAVLSFKVDSNDFPEGLYIGIAFVIAAILIIAGCHGYKLTPKNKVKNKEG